MGPISVSGIFVVYIHDACMHMLAYARTRSRIVHDEAELIASPSYYARVPSAIQMSARHFQSFARLRHMGSGNRMSMYAPHTIVR